MDFYNAEIKMKYLEQFDNLDTREVYSRLFKKAVDTEIELQRDIYDFRDDEIENFIANMLKPKTKESARTYCNVLSSYIQWAMDHSYSRNFTNPLKRRQEYFYSFVKEYKQYISYDEKQAIIHSLVNKQDSFIIEALWNGIQGTQVKELTNLQISDFDFDKNKIYIRDEKGNIARIISPMDPFIFSMAVLTNQEQLYYKSNGGIDFSSKVRDSIPLPSSTYILKGAINNNDENRDKVKFYTIYNRLETIRKVDGLEEYSEALTTKNIVRSGMIYLALQILKRDGRLERKQIEEICDFYNMKYKWSLRDFLNIEMIRSLYPHEIDEIKNAME
ncbi:hypothetical protein SAMN04488689_101347 [Paenibacillus sp. cl6col]|uniref:phage lytic cycle repressor MrpR family protein n=1 Tax=Paenibacillus sp. cl6col TaxID=1761878 RepID=UPI0008835CBF|nr:hypothetical protein [Paenibacillus sp. cl6col]SDE39838.1 hypothetical protein SAMN04488689_101347 [Paenibacillus sp. cl6col]